MSPFVRKTFDFLPNSTGIYYLCAIMPYNKKNSGYPDKEGKGFGKNRSGDNDRQPPKKYGRDQGTGNKDFKASVPGRGDKRPSYNPADKNELAPPRFLPPLDKKPYGGKRNDSKSYERPGYDKKRPDGAFKDNRFEKRPSDFSREKSGDSNWDPNDLANSKVLRKTSNSRPPSDRPDRGEQPFNRERRNDGQAPYKPRTEDGRKSYGDKPAFDRRDDGKGPFKPRNEDGRKSYGDKPADKRYGKDASERPFSKPRRDDNGGKEGFRPKTEGDERKPFRPKYETEVKGKKSYKDKPAVVKTPNERKRELLGTVDEPTDIRLNKYIANSGVCSRREADDLIKQGLVTVNGTVVTEMGHKVKKEDTVKFEGRRILPEPFVYILMNKPKDFITTTDDEKGRKTVMDLVADKVTQRIYPIGRLDRNTTGVLLLTNDGEVAQALTHPTFQIKKIYHVVLDKKVSAADLDKLVGGITLEDGEVFADAVSFVDNEDKRHVGVEIHSGKNRVVRRMFEHLGYEVEKLDRVSVGIFTKKDLPRGKWRYLNQSEVGFLMKLKSKMP
jgi:23S rRNA pseudouridine2605 synthase